MYISNFDLKYTFPTGRIADNGDNHPPQTLRSLCTHRETNTQCEYTSLRCVYKGWRSDSVTSICFTITLRSEMLVFVLCMCCRPPRHFHRFATTSLNLKAPLWKTSVSPRQNMLFSKSFFLH